MALNLLPKKRFFHHKEYTCKYESSITYHSKVMVNVNPLPDDNSRLFQIERLCRRQFKI